MAARLQNGLGGDDGAVQFQHVLLENEVLPPQVDDVGLQGTAGRAIIVETTVVSLEVGCNPVYLKRLGKEEATLRKRLEESTIKGIAFQGSRGSLSHGRRRVADVNLLLSRDDLRLHWTKETGRE